jgi:hypothetical protein
MLNPMFLEMALLPNETFEVQSGVLKPVTNKSGSDRFYLIIIYVTRQSKGFINVVCKSE